jgi:hypothetical protein
VQRHWDATPLTLEFGQLQDELFQIAKYRYYQDGKWSLLNFEAAKVWVSGARQSSLLSSGH